MLTLRLATRLLYSSWKLFGIKQALLELGFMCLVSFMHLAMVLDLIFFPGIHRIHVRNPVFILGHPRSGTTFLHRLLTQTDEYAVFKLWQIFAPSLGIRRFFRPFVPRIGQAFMAGFKDPSAIFADSAHETGAEEIEEEELLFLATFDTQFLVWMTALAFDDADFPELVRIDERQPESRRHRSIRFLRGCLRRQIYDTGRPQIIAKMPYSTLRIKTLLKEFPDAKIIYVARSPLETMPSHLSLHRSFFMNRWGLDRIPRDRLMRYYQRRYRCNIELYRYFHELEMSGALPSDRVKVIHYDQLRANLEKAFDEIVAFTGIEASETLRQKIRDQAARQHGYVRKHTNLPLDEFGVTREQLVRDVPFALEPGDLEPEAGQSGALEETVEGSDESHPLPRVANAGR